MKKFMAVVLSTALCLCFTACGSEPKIEKTEASDSEKQLVIAAATNFFTGSTYTDGAKLYQDTFDSEPSAPEMFAAYTLKCDDVEGFAVDLVLCNVKAEIAYVSNGETVGNDRILFIADNKTGNIYDSITYEQETLNFDGTISDEEDVMIMLLNSGILHEGSSNGYFWGEAEQSTCFKGSDLKEIQTALDKALAK